MQRADWNLAQLHDDDSSKHMRDEEEEEAEGRTKSSASLSISPDLSHDFVKRHIDLEKQN